MAYDNYKNNQSTYTYTGPDGKKYYLNFSGDGKASYIGSGDEKATFKNNKGYIVDDALHAGQKKHLAIALDLYFKKGQVPTEDELYAAFSDAGISGGRSKNAYENIINDIETFKKNNNIDDDYIKSSIASNTVSNANQNMNSYNPQANTYDLLIDAQGNQANRYREMMYDNINRQQTEVDQTLAAAELDAYKMLGQQQLQLESQIADQRMRALKSGTTSAQLAAQQLQNMFAAQSAAQGVAQQVLNQRVTNANQFSQQRAAVEPGLYDLVNQNKGVMAQVEAQRYAAYQGARSYSPAATLYDLIQSGTLDEYKNIYKPN